MNKIKKMASVSDEKVIDLKHSTALESEGRAIRCHGHPGVPRLLSLNSF